MRLKIAAVMAGLLVLGGVTFGQTSADQKSADDYFAKSDWSNAAQAYSGVTAKDPSNAVAWQNLGESYLQLKKYDQAVAAFNRAADLKYRPLVNQVNVARVWGEAGDRTRALAALKQVVASGQGPRLRAYILGSTEFEKLANDAEYKQVLEALRPCRAQEYRQFDFWVGDWQVYNPQNNSAGANLVTLEQDGCLIVEHWKGAGGVETGTSFSYWDVRDRKWHQLYLDNSGDAGHFPALTGEFKDNKMVMLTDPAASPVFRWTWYVISPQHVKQMAEQSTDGQKTWQTIWDSVYVAKTSASNGQ